MVDVSQRSAIARGERPLFQPRNEKRKSLRASRFWPGKARSPQSSARTAAGRPPFSNASAASGSRRQGEVKSRASIYFCGRTRSAHGSSQRCPRSTRPPSPIRSSRWCSWGGRRGSERFRPLPGRTGAGGRGPGGGGDRELKGEGLHKTERGRKTARADRPGPRAGRACHAARRARVASRFQAPTPHLEKDKASGRREAAHRADDASRPQPGHAVLRSCGAYERGRRCFAGKPETVITEESLKQVYGIDVRVISWNGFRIVYPEGGA